jgi:DNA-binding NarL/FixJ family response regulator
VSVPLKTRILLADDHSEKTVERHRANVLEKLGVRDRVALTRYAIRWGLIEP